MKKWWENIRNQAETILKYFLVLATIFLISLLFPNNIKFKYVYEQGQIWSYDDLESPVEFAVLKPNEEIEAARQEVIANTKKYFSKDVNLLEEAQARFENEFKGISNTLDQGVYAEIFEKPNAYILKGKGILSKYYNLGIIHPDSAHHEGESILIVEENIVSKISPLDLEMVKEQISRELASSSLNHASVLYPLLERNLEPNIYFNTEITDKFKQAALDKISLTRGRVKKGELIVTRNGVITQDVYQKLQTYQKIHEENINRQKSHWLVFGGYLLLTSLIVGVYLIYLQYHNRMVFASARKLLFMLFWLLLYGFLVYMVEQNETLSAYMIPFCIAPIVIKTFYNDRLALFSLIVIVLIASFLSKLGYEFTFLQILAGIVAVLTNNVTRYWSKFFYSILFIFLAYGFGFLGLSLIKEGSILSIDWNVYIWLIINVILTLLAYPLVPLLERMFGFTSSITLSELSDVNKPLLRQLSQQAPGTFQHSLQVGNLAEAAADAIGANAQLVKVAALYHDIGKMKNPRFFIENQSNANPHDDLPEKESAAIIIDHVIEGEKMAKKNRLPSIITNFIVSHHGTMRVSYFYINHINKNPDGAKDEAAFRYPGPKPKTKEEAIVMIADSIEAASKSLKDPKETDINNLVDKIIKSKVDFGQLEDASISFSELEQVRYSIKKVLKSIYHIRVEYPEEKKVDLPEEGDPSKPKISDQKSEQVSTKKS